MAGHKTLSEVKARLLANPVVRAHYEAQKAEFKALIKEIRERTSKSLEYLAKNGD